MIALLAEAAQLPDANNYAALGWVAVIIGAIFFILNQGGEFINRFRAKEPTPPLHEQYATKAELEEVKDQVRDLDKKIDSQFDKLREERRTSVAALHGRIEKVITEIRLEIREDNSGIHEKINKLVEGFSQWKGRVEAELKDSNSPFAR